jgi:hypothetical protein
MDAGTVDYIYTSSAVQKDGNGNLVNTDLSYVLPTVTSVTMNDGLGNTWTTDYLYEDGKYTATDQYDGRFAGFHIVTETHEDNSFKKSYFHQGNQEDVARTPFF